MDHTYFLSWTSQFEDVLELHGLGVIVKPEDKPAKNLSDGSLNPLYSKDKLVLSWIKATTSSPIKTLLIYVRLPSKPGIFSKRGSPLSLRLMYEPSQTKFVPSKGIRINRCLIILYMPSHFLTLLHPLVH